MRRFLLIASVVGAMTVAGATAANAGTPVQVVDWHHHHHPVVVDRCYYPPVRYVRPQVAYYPQVVAPPVCAAPVVAAPPFVAAPPAGFVSLRGRNFGVQFGF
jgi:hypothetical protein